MGGVRSGKSNYAVQIAKNIGNKVTFVATGEPLDDEMKTRIQEHKKNRPRQWRTIEQNRGIAGILAEETEQPEVILIDCLTLLVSNILVQTIELSEVENELLIEINEIISYMKQSQSHFILVSNEVGLGVVPDTKLGRIYRDMLGKVNQLIAENATEVYFMVAGIPLKIR